MADLPSSRVDDEWPRPREEGVGPNGRTNRTGRPPMFEIARTYTFDAAHQLHWHRGACARMHGHSYALTAVVRGTLDSNGVVMDFSDLDQVANGVLEALDHRYLNEVIENPTVENLAAHIWDGLEAGGLDVSEVCLWETARSWARLRR